jgi:tetratricopeptide (TPR) repeat protein
MADSERPVLPTPSPEQRRVALGQYERAQQVTAKGDHDYAIQLLLTCCKLDPGNLTYRRALRQVEKNKYNNNMRGSWTAMVTTTPTKAKLKAAKHNQDFVKVLELGEEILTQNPWDTGAQLDMAEAADQLGLLDMAVWLAEQARQKDPRDANVNRALARLCEKRGNFNVAIKLWELVREVVPTDLEAQHKAKDLAAADTIARGQYAQAAGVASDADASTKEYLAKTPGPVGRSPADRVSREAEPLRARIQADPTNPNAHLNLASVYRRADQREQARTVLVEALGATGNHFDIVAELADLDIETFRRDLAVADEKLKKKPNDAALQDLRGNLLKEINARELELYRRRPIDIPATNRIVSSSASVCSGPARSTRRSGSCNRSAANRAIRRACSCTSATASSIAITGVWHSAISRML